LGGLELFFSKATWIKKYIRIIVEFAKSNYFLIIFLVSLFAMISTLLGYRGNVAPIVSSSEKNVQDKLRVAAVHLSTLTSTKELDLFRQAEDVKRPEWKALRFELKRFAKQFNVKYAYYLRIIDGENGKRVQYIVDNDDDPKTRVGIDTETEDLSDHKDIPPVLERRLTFVTPLGNYVAGWDGLITGYAPILYSDGSVAAIAGVDIDDRPLLGMYKAESRFRYLNTTTVVILLLCGVFGFWKLRQDASAAEEANIAKTRFLSRMSHEIRTPMNAVLGMSDLAVMNYGKPQGLDYIANIKQAGNNLLALINGILDLSAVESGKIQMVSKPYAVASFLNDVITIARMRLNDKTGIEFTIDVDPDIPSILIGDVTRVREILVNLLSNAVKYTEQGLISFKANSKSKGENAVVMEFVVSDTGIGIKPSDLARLFADFARVEDKYVSNIEGTGLGLSITRALCIAMGGSVVVNSEYGVGSTFTATIRQECLEDCVPVGNLDTWTGVHLEPSVIRFIAPEFRVLIVDDVSMNLQVAEGLLEPYNMMTKTCLSGKEAVSLVQESEYDLVLMDHMMPEMDGFEAVAAIRALGGRFEQLPIVALTANTVVGMKDLFLKNGFNDFLAKPIEIPNLNGLIERWVPLEKRAINERRLLSERRMQQERRSLAERRAVEKALQGAGDKYSAYDKHISLIEEVAGLDRLFSIGGLDVAKGIAITGSNVSVYMDVLKTYCKDASSRTVFFDFSHAQSDIKGFTTQVHALKSASGSIGAVAVADEAYALERAGLHGDLAFIQKRIDGFRERIEHLVESISSVLAADEATDADLDYGEGEDAIGSIPVDEAIVPIFEKLIIAMEAEDIVAVDGLMSEIMSGDMNRQIKDVLSDAADMVLTSDFDQAVATIKRLIR
jgi:signal transduction histidine kinase/CheY-like chemotaxis protein